MRVNDEFEVIEETVRVIRLYRNGVLIRDTDGHPVEYPSVDDAEYVGRNWDTYGAVPMHKLTDTELLARLRRIEVMDHER